MKQPIIIGWMVIGAVILLISLSRLGGLSLSKSDFPIVKVFFENVNGLKNHDPVFVHGFQVGFVSNIQLQEDGCMVSIEFTQQINLFSDAQAEIQIKELMAGKQIVLWPGKNGKKLDSFIQGKKTFDWASGLSSLGETSQKLPEMINNIHRLSKNLVEITDSISFKDMNPLLAELRLTLQDIRILTADLKREQLFPEAKQTLQSVRKLSDDLQPRINQTFSLADSSLELLPNTLRLVQKELLEADSLMKNLESKLALLEKPGTFAWSALHDSTLAARIDSSVYNFNKTLDHIRLKKIHVHLSMSPKKKAYQE